MYLLDKPYASDFLIDTIKKNNFPIVKTEVAEVLANDTSMNWISEKEAIHTLVNEAYPKFYLNSENAIAWIINNNPTSKLAEQIQVFKDKAKFRELIKDVFPDFFFKTVGIEEIQELNLEDLQLPFVIKPAIGFFSLGVHIIHTKEDWEVAKAELNYENLKSIYPPDVLDTSLFIIEEFIVGEEYAIDCYFNVHGEVVVLNILHHKFSSGTDVSDRVYSTSKEIILQYKNKIEEFLTPIGQQNDLKNFPMHVEVRIDALGKICPIEINPMRFGGWCTTGDLTWYAYGINSYEYFFHQQQPNWDKIFNAREDKKYSIVILNNNSGYEAEQIKSFDFELLKKDLENVLVIRELDYSKIPVFGFLFTETSLENESELDEILVSDLKKYIII